MSPKALRLSVFTALALSLATPAGAGEPLVIKDLVIATSISDAQKETTLTAVRAFYAFWNSGDEALLKQALATGFVDRTLPPGRPQGPDGPAFASKSFRGAVPDLGVTVEKMIVAGDYVTVHMVFTGHFTGAMGNVHGAGQPIAFNATDLLKIADGRITDNWHIEDNLTLLQEMGIAKLAP